MDEVPAQNVTLTLSHDEVIVLFNWLHRLEDDNQFERLAMDKAELVMLWNLNAATESAVDKVFSPAFKSDLDAAKARLLED
jgi:hypothetical protein